MDIRNPVSGRLKAYIANAFSTSDAPFVQSELEELEVPFDKGRVSERLLAAIVLTADGRRDKFEQATRLAKDDWRDVLASAGLVNADWPDRLDQRLGAQ